MAVKPKRKAKGRLSPLRIILIILAAGILAGGAFLGSEALRHRSLLRQYPLRYKRQIVETARQFGLEPWHVAAVVRCESSFDAQAVSSAGAMGLMQIMPETGEWLAGKFGEKDSFEPENLFDPDTNLKYGCWYLNWLMDRYGRDVTLATAAYHAGQGKVDQWLQDAAISPDGTTIDPDAIPFSSTKTYVRRILTACAQYEELYEYDI